MGLPCMGTETPRTKKAVEDAERVCPTESHRYGYMISFAQKLELELKDARNGAASVKAIYDAQPGLRDSA